MYCAKYLESLTIVTIMGQTYVALCIMVTSLYCITQRERKEMSAWQAVSCFDGIFLTVSQHLVMIEFAQPCMVALYKYGGRLQRSCSQSSLYYVKTWLLYWSCPIAFIRYHLIDKSIENLHSSRIKSGLE